MRGRAESILHGLEADTPAAAGIGIQTLTQTGEDGGGGPVLHVTPYPHVQPAGAAGCDGGGGGGVRGPRLGAAVVRAIPRAM